LKKVVRKYKDGDIVFQEGEASDTAFVITKGEVSLLKSGAKSPLELARIQPGDMFGEMGILDQGLRSATAKAIGATTLEVIERKDFLAAVQADPDLALSVMKKLVQRLRETDDALVRMMPGSLPLETTSTEPAITKAGAPQPDFLTKLFSVLGGNRPKKIEIRVAPFIGETEETAREQTRLLAKALSSQKRSRVRVLDAPLQPTEPDQDPETILPDTLATGRSEIDKTKCDLLIWGDIPPPGTTLHLRFIPAEKEDPGHPEIFRPDTVLCLPVNFGPEFLPLLIAVSFGTMPPKGDDDGKEITQRSVLEATLYDAFPVIKNLPPDVTTKERASIQMCFGNAAFRMARQNGLIDLFQIAAQSYQEALRGLSERNAPLDWAMTQMYLGKVLRAIAERGGDNQMLESAADAFGNALKVLNKDETPYEWASTKNQLGLILYLLDMRGADVDLLKQSLAAFQDALQVFNRTETPLRWAEVMNNFAQTAQVLGEQLRNPEVLETSVDACYSALDIRKEKTMPVLWAATQNNLGSALFHLGKLTHEEERLEKAVDAFEKARDVYMAHGASKMAAVIEKNLSHVSGLLEELIANRLPPKMRWETEAGEEDTGN
jgi:CRP-like cAMP-binding protein/tetratricopeptide (TPR) repeat protein